MIIWLIIDVLLVVVNLVAILFSYGAGDTNTMILNGVMVIFWEIQTIVDTYRYDNRHKEEE